MHVQILMKFLIKYFQSPSETGMNRVQTKMEPCLGMRWINCVRCARY